MDNVEALHQELERLSAEIIEASEERAQAAEYGLVVLEEKQALQQQHDELSSLYESTKNELETSVNAFKQVQVDYERRLREAENQRERLLDEMEARETTLIAKVGKLEEDGRQVERRLKQSLSEQEHLTEHNTFLTGEIDRQRRELDLLKEDNKKLRLEQNNTSKENLELHKEIEKHEKRIEELSKFKEEYASLLETNRTLKHEAEELHQHYESILTEKEDLESQTRETMAALNEEREAKDMLESRLKEESIRTPAHPSWAIEKEVAILASDEHRNNHNGDRFLTINGPVDGGIRIHSTPLSGKKAPSLLSELQTSFMASVDSSELEALHRRCQEAEDSITALQREKLVLEERVAAYSVHQTEATSEISRIREEQTRLVSERDQTIQSLREEILIKEELQDQLRNKLSAASAERASMEIEVGGMKDEVQRIKQASLLEVEKIQKEYTQEQVKSVELKSQVTVLEDQMLLMSNTVEKLESIVYSSHSELTSMTDDLRNLHKMVVTLGTDGSRSLSREVSPVARDSEEGGGLDSEGLYYSLQLKQGKASVRVHDESHSLFAIVRLHEQMRSVRAPLEQFTKMMLERSLAQSARHIPTDTLTAADKLSASGRRGAVDMEAIVNKWKAKLTHKAEEISNLRAIMKARQTTADVATSSLRSKLEGQARTHQTELTRLKHHNKLLKKDRDENNSLRAMYTKRCEEYVDEVSKTRREIETLRLTNDELMFSLKATIQRKLELSQELEEYRIEQERLHNIPKQLEASRI